MKIGPLQINLRRLGVFIAIAILLVMVMNFNTRFDELGRLQDKAATAKVEATAVKVTQHVLETQVALSTSPAAAEEYAREQAKLAQPGDIVVIPVAAPGQTPEPAPTPTPVYTSLTKWDVWMTFIFGK